MHSKSNSAKIILVFCRTTEVNFFNWIDIHKVFQHFCTIQERSLRRSLIVDLSSNVKASWRIPAVRASSPLRIGVMVAKQYTWSIQILSIQIYVAHFATDRCQSSALYPVNNIFVNFYLVIELLFHHFPEHCTGAMKLSRWNIVKQLFLQKSTIDNRQSRTIMNTNL